MTGSDAALGHEGWALLDLVQIRTNKRFGSGLLVGPGVVLTALHCVADPEHSWTLHEVISVNLWRELVGFADTRSRQDGYAASVLWQPTVIHGESPPDIAVLQLVGRPGEPVPRPTRHGPLLYGDLSMSLSEVTVTGFPVALQGSKLPGGRSEGAFTGQAHLFQLSSPTISFTSDLVASDSKSLAWSGLSGGPLIRGEALVAIMRGGRPQFRIDRHLEAEPLAPLLRDPRYAGLAKCLGAQDEISGPISSDELIALKRAIDQARISSDSIRNAYLISYAGAMTPSVDTRDATVLVDDVVAHGVLAIRQFLSRLVALKPGAHQILNSWVSRQPVLADFQLLVENRVRAEESPVVLIKILATAETCHAISPRERTYVVEAWVFKATTETKRVDPGLAISEIKHAFGRLPEIIQTFVTRSLGYLPTSCNPTVELALPTDLLADGVERWVVRGRTRDRPLGRRFPLVLRSCDRLYDREYETSWFDWRQSWNGLQPIDIDDEKLHWIDTAEAWGEQLYDSINGRSMICVGLACAGPDGIALLIEAGGAIAIWLRDEPGNRAAARDALRAIVYGKARDLPAKIHQQRPVNTGPIAWEGMALLYDDPNRLPPDAQFRFQPA